MAPGPAGGELREARAMFDVAMPKQAHPPGEPAGNANEHGPGHPFDVADRAASGEFEEVDAVSDLPMPKQARSPAQPAGNAYEDDPGTPFGVADRAAKEEPGEIQAPPNDAVIEQADMAPHPIFRSQVIELRKPRRMQDIIPNEARDGEARFRERLQLLPDRNRRLLIDPFTNLFRPVIPERHKSEESPHWRPAHVHAAAAEPLVLQRSAHIQPVVEGLRDRE